MDCMRKFESFGFHVKLIICDGASVNLTMLKILLGKQGVFGSSPGKHVVPTTFRSPFTGENIHVMICPSHQVSVIINDCSVQMLVCHQDYSKYPLFCNCCLLI